MDVEVTDNPDKARYEIVADGELAGFAQYHLRDGVIAFTHTQTDDRFRGHGLGSRLVQASLDDGPRAAPGGAALLPVREQLDRRPP